jgi:protein SCO1/2
MHEPTSITDSLRKPWSRRTFVLAGMGLLAAGCRKATPPSFHSLDITGADFARNFQLHDAAGQLRSLADYSGKVVLIFFGFTQCPDVCPTALARAAEIKQRLGDDAKHLQVIFVTLDPERDKPTILKAYTAAFDPTFISLSGDLEQTEKVAMEFKIFFKKVPTGASYALDHTALSYVFDPRGRVRLALRHEQSARDCADDIRTILHST